MKGDLIPRSDHIARYCKPSHAPDGQVQATAFLLRQEEQSLSVNWLEFLNASDRINEIDQLRKIYSETFNRVGASAKIAVLSVGEILEKVKKETPDNRVLKILHDPIIDGDQSHAEVQNLKPDNELIAELILEVIQETYPARQQ